MFVVCVTVFVTPEFVPQFLAATLDNARHTRQEPHNVRFDFSRSAEDPARFFLYEVYRSKDDFATHQQTEHYLRWKNAVAPWMAQPRVGVRHTSLFFDNAEQ
jgi:(4S)-4-hydroxy-5-phosphonooxypentane-2,3-dione isomerase